MKVPSRGHRLGGLLAALLTLTACHPPGQASTAQSAPRPQTTQARQSTTAPSTRTTPATGSTERTDPASGLPWIALGTLPTQARQTYRLILNGGPYPYARDGVTFQNREGTLPRRPRGTYHEYTVRTPGSSDRGARRIVCATPPAQAGTECYYTADHYATFGRIRP